MQKFLNQILGTLTATGKKGWAFVTSFKQTFSTVHGVVSSFLRFGIILVLLFASGTTASKMNEMLGSSIGIGSGLIIAVLSIVLYIKYITYAKNFVDLVDGFVALTILMTVIVAVFFVGAIASTKIAEMFTQEISWLSFAAFLFFAIFLAFKVGDFSKEEEHEL